MDKIRLRPERYLKPNAELVAAQLFLGKIMTDNFEFFRRYTEEYEAKKQLGKQNALSPEDMKMLTTSIYEEWNMKVAPDGKINAIERRDIARLMERALVHKAMQKAAPKELFTSIEAISETELRAWGNEYFDPAYWPDEKSKELARKYRSEADTSEAKYNKYLDSVKKGLKR